MAKPFTSRIPVRIPTILIVGVLYVVLIVSLLNTPAPVTAPDFLSPAEQNWLTQNIDEIEVLFGYQAPPNAFHDETGQYVGLLVDYLHEFEALLGVTFRVREFATWDELMVYAQTATTDFFIVGIAETEERREYLLHTDAFIKVPYVIITRNQVEGLQSLADVTNETVCTVRNYAVNEYIAAYYDTIEPLHVSDNLEGLRAVSTSQCDAMVINQAYATYLIEEQGLANLKIAGESGYMNRLSAATPLHSPVLFAILDKTIDEISPDRQRELSLKWISPAASNHQPISRFLTVTGIVLITLLGISWGWTWLLRSQVRNKTRVISEQLQQLESAQTELQNALNNEREQRILNEALLGIASGITSTLDPAAVMQRILDYVGEIVPHDAAGIHSLQENKIIPTCWHGYSDDHIDAVMAAPLDVQHNAIYQQMIATREPVVIMDTQTCPEWQSSPESAWVRSYLGVPIRSRNEVIGFLNLDSAQPEFFTEQHIASAKSLVQQIAIAVENAQLYEQLEHYTEDLELRVSLRTEALSRANAELQRLSKAKDEFVSNVSHELRTPITSFTLRHYLLRKDPSQLEKHLAVLERDTTRLNHIVEDLLRLSRLDQGRTKVNLNPLNLNAVASNLVNDRLLQAQEKDLALTFSGQIDLPIVMADQGLIEQVMSILLTNAINYTPAGGQILIRTQTEHQAGQEWAGFSVQDTGLGIPIEEQPRLFERFFQGTASRESGIPGTGLGLSIAKEIIDRHAGRICAKSAGVPGEGTTFSVWLPVKQPTDDEQPD